ncbi:alpha/beta-hydrolase [Aureobasidium pullulans]|nr:alpha/beta-hydrolase [Aureobasidium pullulans]
MKPRLNCLFARNARPSIFFRQAVSAQPGRGLFTTQYVPLRHKLSPRNHVSVNQRRSIFGGVSPFVLVPSAFVGLLIGHWLHKCLLMVLFQNKIIYMPSLPPGSRREKLEDYSKTWAGVSWEERQIRSLDGTKLAVAIARPEESSAAAHNKRKQIVVLYFQGNGASIPPRTPMLSNIIRAAAKDSPHDWALLALSYRGYWTSSGRAHQRGIEKDAQAFVAWAAQTYIQDPEDSELILWGQSIGAGVAAYAASKHLESAEDTNVVDTPAISRLILETPFVSIQSMLAAIYPDWWVPYKHLWPFLRSWWDSEEALRKVAQSRQPPKVFMVVASGDEIVPRVQADQLETLCKDLHLDVTRKDVLGALHTQASTLEQGKRVIATWMRGGEVQ